MAGAHCITTSSTSYLLRPSGAATSTPKRPFFVISTISIPSPRKLNRRENYLRKKLLKTLTKPPTLFPELPPTSPIIPVESRPQPAEQDADDEISVQEHKELENVIEFRESEVAIPIVNDSVGKFPKGSILNYGLWFFGAFVFQTLCAVWVLGSADLGVKNDQKEGISGVEGENESNMKLLLNGNVHKSLAFRDGGVVYVDEDEMRRKMEEIKKMAREAREKEQSEMVKNNGLGNKDDYDGHTMGKSGIISEVDERLVKLKKRLENARENMQVMLGSGGDGKKEMDAEVKRFPNEEEGNMALVFKKKYKFRDLASELSHKPKGFGSLRENTREEKSRAVGDEVIMEGSAGDDEVALLHENNEIEVPDFDIEKGVSMKLDGNGGKKQVIEPKRSLVNTSWQKKGRQEKEGGEKVLENLIRKERNHQKPLVEAAESSTLDTASEKTSKHNQLDVSSIYVDRDVGKRRISKSQDETDFWWFNLSYVLAILMHRGDDEGPQGLFTLKSNSSTNGELSHIVAFEDRTDASNFCYILESFFEDLEDFRADIVPLSVEELREAVRSSTKKKIIVVKKGQLQLYAGQPLSDVEAALRSLAG